jgi:glutathione S-transferase
MILDYLDDQAGSMRALLPTSGIARRQALRYIALATGAADKGIHLVIERVFRPVEKHHAPWSDRCRQQVHGALTELDRLCVTTGDREWLLGSAMTQADVTVASYVTYLHDAMPLDLAPYPALCARVDNCEALPVFKQFYLPFDAPEPHAVPTA